MIVFCGDPHGDVAHIIHHVEQTRPAAVIILGDLCLPEPFDVVFHAIRDLTEIWYIH